MSYTPETAPWKLPDTRFDRSVDGDTQRYKAFQTVRWPTGKVVSEHLFMVRLLETDTPEKRNDYEGWLASKKFAEEFLRDKTVDLRLTGRIDVYGRWLGWALVEGRSLSHALNEVGLGKYTAIRQQLAALAVEEFEEE